MTKLLLNWAPTATGSGGDYWSEAEVEGFGTVEVNYNAQRDRWDFWVSHEGSQGWKKLGSAPSSALTFDHAKQHMEETYLPPMIRLLLETRQNPKPIRRNPNLLLDWKVHNYGWGHQIHVAEIGGAGKLYMEIFPDRKLHRAYFWPHGSEISNRLVDVPAGLDTLYDRLRWVEDNLIPPMYRMLLETRENPRRTRRNPDLTLNWIRTDYTPFHTIYRAHLPGTGEINISIHREWGRVSHHVSLKPEVDGEISRNELKTLATYPTGRSDEEYLAWAERDFISPLQRMLLETKENPRRSRKNPDLLLNWHAGPSHEFGRGECFTAAVPGLGEFLVQSKFRDPGGSWSRSRAPEIILFMEGPSDKYQITNGPRGLSDQELLRWVEDNLIPPLIHAMLSVGGQP